MAGAGRFAGILLLIVAILIPPALMRAAACALSKNQQSALCSPWQLELLRWFRRIRLHHCRYLFAADGEKRGLSALTRTRRWLARDHSCFGQLWR